LCSTVRIGSRALIYLYSFSWSFFCALFVFGLSPFTIKGRAIGFVRGSSLQRAPRDAPVKRPSEGDTRDEHKKGSENPPEA
jgi:hypothetical protein